MESALAELVERVTAAAAARTPLCIRSGGTKDFYGNAPRGERLDPRSLSGIVAYEPGELVITARAGTPLAVIEDSLTQAGQMLAFEPPHFGPGATLGGAIASGLAGPRRASFGVTHGSVRDFVLGMRLLDGRGQVLSFGGTVMKNVAGYDVSRVLVGSLGILGVIVEASVKVLPRPACELTLRFAFEERAALDTLLDWGRQPWPISASAWSNGRLMVRLSGAESPVRAARARLGGEEVEAEAASAFWSGIREQTHPFFEGERPTWRLSVPATADPDGLTAERLIEWGGALRWLRSDASPESIRALAVALGGHATRFRGGDRSVAAFTPVSPALMGIHRRLKSVFDPAGIFNPGRLFADL